MNERDIFIAALEQPTAEARSEYLGLACAGDSTLRQRVEGLLQLHEKTGEFLQTPLVERLAEGVAALEDAAETARNPSAPHRGSDGLGFLSPSQQPDSLGKLGHYEVLEVIGRGGMGIVLRAFDERLHRVVAIKVMAAPLATNVAARKRFLREARAAAAVCHDHIVTIHAVEESGDLPYLVMQCVAGLSLQQRIDRDGPLELHEILRIGLQTAAGLAAAHAQGLIHRDIKPANILLENGVERVRITDFGLARAAADASISQSGVVIGTPQYMAPEQARGEALDGRSDLFSLGSVLYAMCTGRAPFRAATSIAVLKRVCEEAPSLIREANADIPDWLVELIDKLHAKNPEERYQSAAEVAEVLGRYLAHLQHSTPLPPAVLLASGGRKPPDFSAPAGGLRSLLARKRRWVVAAALLLGLAATFAIAEGTGTTKIAATVVRLLTPEGTLVVEMTDPGVKVTIDGDGGLVISGVGQHEVRLKPGIHKLLADKNGQPVQLERELVTVSRGGREVVRVKLETAPAPPVAKVETGAFVLLAAEKERKFDTLAEAVLGSSAGDTIEVRGNGPFVTEPIKITRALTIRAGEGFRPVIKLSPKGLKANAPLLSTQVLLILEGTEFQAMGQDAKEGEDNSLLESSSSLHVANCRFLTGGNRCITTHPSSPVCELRNCEFPSLAPYPVFTLGQGLVMDNSVQCGAAFFSSIHGKERFVRLTRNTFLAESFDFFFGLAKAADQVKVVHVETSGNIFGGDSVFRFVQAPDTVLPPGDSERFLARMLGWQGGHDLFAVDGPFLALHTTKGFQELAKPMKSLADWRKFWGTAETGSIEGSVRYHGGDLVAKVTAAPEKLTPDDFRLRPDSAGYRAGPDGKDLGADIDMVGPGKAYERWKKTPEFQQWRKETQKLMAVAPSPKAEPGAFVVLGRTGIEIRTDNTLAEAVVGASEGDTIEVRGIGPFVTEPIKITRALTIRAGEGFRPVIKLNSDPAKAWVDPLAIDAPLILEGLELELVGGGLATPDDGWHSMLAASFASDVRYPLFAANCRFVCKADRSVLESQATICEFRNCEFLCPRGPGVVSHYQPGRRLTLANCCLASSERTAVELHYGQHPEVNEALVRFSRNTFVTGHEAIALSLALQDNRVRVETSGNVFDAASVLNCNLGPTEKFLNLKEAEASLLKLLGWQGERNLYAIPGRFLGVGVAGKPGLEPTKLITGLAEWRRLWGTTETGSLEGRPRYQGGDLLAKVRTAPGQVTRDDFRLRPDSAGYRAGPDGKDLGADIDMVGPGKAYERWKKTPEYQQWLKETGQKE